MGNSKDYNEVIFAGKQVDEARCGMDEIKEKRRPEKSRVLELEFSIYLGRRLSGSGRRPSTHPTQLCTGAGVR
jgi:hypothetical protein